MTYPRSALRLPALVAVTTAIALAGTGCARASAADLYPGGDAQPEVDALRSVVPDSLLAVARADGSVHLHEVVLYAFVPHGAGFANAVLFTDSAIVRRSPAGARRHQRPFEVRAMRAPMKHGYLIVTPPGETPDTVYGALTKSEVARLVAATELMNRAPNARRVRTK